MNEGDFVEVYNGFTGGWRCGFIVDEVVDWGALRLYQLRRIGDAGPLPVLFEADRVRKISRDALAR